MIAEPVPAAKGRPARERALQAIAFAVRGRDRDAIAEADRAVALAPRAAAVHLVRSTVLREAGRHRESLRAAEEAVRLAPDDARAHRIRAAALASVRRLVEARAEAVRAAELAPDDPAVLLRLGDLELDVDPAAAERHYRRGLRRDPRSAAAHAGLARALRRLGRRDEAEAAYERAAAVDPAVAELRRRARVLLWAILQAGIGTLLAVLVLGWIPDLVSSSHLGGAVRASGIAAILAVAGPLVLLGWTAVRIRRLGRGVLAPDVREDLRDLSDLLATDTPPPRAP